VNTFLTDPIMNGSDWQGLELAVARACIHCGWDNVYWVGRSGDRGADILATRRDKEGKSQSYAFQSKAVTGDKYVGTSAIQQALEAQEHYRIKTIIIATNGEFTRSCYKRKDELVSSGIDVRLWNGSFLSNLINKSPILPTNIKPLRSYQQYIKDKVSELQLESVYKGLFIVATGLGKTVIAASIADHFFRDRGMKKVLVLCHATDLAFQLQKAFWSQCGKDIPTRIFMAGSPPSTRPGITFGLYQSFQGYLGGISPDAFDLVIVDEAHHAVSHGFRTCINHLRPKFLIGMTATPWRGDGQQIEEIFGVPLAKVSLVDGMRDGYLAAIDYRLMCDNINWEEVPKVAGCRVSIRDLNKRLFLPQRDAAIISQIRQAAEEFPNPKIAVFSPSVKHAEKFAEALTSAGIPALNLSISDKTERNSRLLRFTTGELMAVTSVDVLNEGIDVPDVNILVFLRATHSRRIFVQQLGRGLRLAEGKLKVIVLDFVSDIRRLAAVSELKSELEAASPERTVFLNEGVVAFSNEKTEKFVDQWLNDIASLQDGEDTEKLIFPTIEFSDL
jgi:superfamily II DNA or RNA helicase